MFSPAERNAAREVQVRAGGASLEGSLAVPAGVWLPIPKQIYFQKIMR